MAILENTYWHSAELTVCHPEFSPVATLDPTAICMMSFRSVWHWHTDNPWVSVIGWPFSLFFSNHLSAVSLLCLELKDKNRALFHPLKSREIHNFCLSTWILLLWSKLEVLDNHSWHWFKAPYLCLSRVCIYLILKATRWGGTIIVQLYTQRNWVTRSWMSLTQDQTAGELWSQDSKPVSPMSSFRVWDVRHSGRH